MNKEIRISLTHADFAALVRGQVVERQSLYAQGPIKIAIQDIGFPTMITEIDSASAEFWAREGEKSQGGRK